MTDKEINEAVARKLGKPTVNVEPHQITHGHRVRFGHSKDGKDFCHDGCEAWFPEGYAVPDYCHSIEAAWEIVEYIRESDKIVALREEKFSHSNCKIWEMSSKPGPLVDEWAATAPMALCLAFLKLP